MQSELKIGQQVKLSSGGPLMTIDHLEEAAIGCVWFEGTKLRAANFNPDVLSRSSSLNADDEAEQVDNFG